MKQIINRIVLFPIALLLALIILIGMIIYYIKNGSIEDYIIKLANKYENSTKE